MSCMVFGSMREGLMAHYIHPAAAESFERRMAAIVQGFVRGTHESQDEWSPSPYSELSLTEEDIVGPIVRQDIDGRTMSRVRLTIAGAQGTFRLERDGCTQLVELCGRVAEQSNIKAVAASEDIWDYALTWIAKNLLESRNEVFCDTLQDMLLRKVSEYEIWIPLRDVALEEPIVLGQVLITPVTQDRIANAWDGFAQSATQGGMTLKEARERFVEFRRGVEGKAIVVVAHRALPDHAVRLARLEAERICSLLSCLQPINESCVARSYLGPQGAEAIESEHSFLFENGVLGKQQAGLAHPLPFALRLSSKALATPWLKERLGAISSLLTDERPNDFSQKLLRSLYTYSHCARARSPGEKLVFAFAALETLLLVDNQEPIQHNLGRRIAMLMGRDVAERKVMMGLVRGAYALRSKFMHHGEVPPRESYELTNDLLRLAYQVFMTVLGMHANTDVKDSLGAWLDVEFLSTDSDRVRTARGSPGPKEPEIRSAYTMRVRRAHDSL